MAHFMKSSAGVSGGLTRHYERHKKENGEYIQFANQEIDISKTHLNYNLAVHQKLPQLEFIKKRTSEVYCLNRKDVNVMGSWVVTAPKEIEAGEQEKFFQETYKFLERRYGKENVISAHVHLDETSPHIHFAFVPVVKDKDKGHLKVSAKECVNRVDMKSFHSDLSKCLENAFGRDVGVLNEATKDGNKSIEELKIETREKLLTDIEKTMLEKKQYAEEMVRKLNKMIENCGETFKTVDEIERITPQKTITGAIKGVSFEDVLKLQDTAKSSLDASIKLRSLQGKFLDLEDENEKLKKQVPSIKQRSHYAMLESDNKSLEKKLDMYEGVYKHYKNEHQECKDLLSQCLEMFEDMPNELRNNIVEKVYEQKPVNKSRSWEMER